MTHAKKRLLKLTGRTARILSLIVLIACMLPACKKDNPAPTPPTSLTIISFTPSTSAAGTSVNIAGTGFSTTPGNNIVLFNGVAATVTASTSTSITVTVPAGATSGTITVTVGSSTATSASNFIVTGGAALHKVLKTMETTFSATSTFPKDVLTFSYDANYHLSTLSVANMRNLNPTTYLYTYNIAANGALVSIFDPRFNGRYSFFGTTVGKPDSLSQSNDIVKYTYSPLTVQSVIRANTYAQITNSAFFNVSQNVDSLVGKDSFYFSTETNRYTYDAQKSFMKLLGAPIPDAGAGINNGLNVSPGFILAQSLNNITSISTTQMPAPAPGQKIKDVTMVYTYDADGYPTKRTTSFGSNVYVTYFTYAYL